MAEAVRSSTIVGILTPRRLEICHSDPVIRPADHLQAYIQSETH